LLKQGPEELMPTRQLARAVAACLVALIVAAPRCTFAADETGISMSARVLKSTILDPTTYAPAIIFYDATTKDWNTSQPFFEAGYLEHNARFTLSGRPDDVPISFNDGQSKIMRDSLQLFALSAAHNAVSHAVVESLRVRYPHHAKLVSALGWVERVAVASLMTYRTAGPHYRQWQRNQEMLTTLGIK
jgi:hypothetical protein